MAVCHRGWYSGPDSLLHDCNGHGRCPSHRWSASCRCHAGWHGEWCQYDDEDWWRHNWWVGTVVGAIILIAIIVAIVFCCRARRNRNVVTYEEVPQEETVYVQAEPGVPVQQTVVYT